MAPILELSGVRKEFTLRRGLFRDLLGPGPTVVAVNDLTLRIDEGEVVGLVGESGSGKSTLAYIIVRLLPVTRGTVRYRGEDVTHRSRQELREFWQHVQIIFQDTHSSFNPRKTIGQTLADPLRARGMPRRDQGTEVVRLLSIVGLSAQFVTRYPHELSGGQRQRVGVARALGMQPEFLIADEPVSSLDVSLQAQILNLLTRLREELRLTMLFVSHDLAVVKHISTRVAVMYAGRIVEAGPTRGVLERPAHPYTQALIAATPAGLRGRGRRWTPLGGDPPDPADRPGGCPFAPRCPQVFALCHRVAPVAVPLGSGRIVECHLFGSPDAGRATPAADLVGGDRPEVAGRAP